MYAGTPLQETIELLSPLTKLEVLDLGSNLLGGTITAGVAVFTNAKKLILMNMGLDGKGRMFSAHMRLCVSLTFHFCAGELPKELCALVNLTDLNVSSNKFQGESYAPAYLSSYILLTFSLLFAGELPKELGKLINLEYFGVAHNSIGGELCGMSDM